MGDQGHSDLSSIILPIERLDRAFDFYCAKYFGPKALYTRIEFERLPQGEYQPHIRVNGHDPLAVPSHSNLSGTEVKQTLRTLIELLPQKIVVERADNRWNVFST